MVAKDVRIKELLTIKPMKIAIFDTIMIIGSPYNKIKIISIINRLLLFSDCVSAREHKN